MDSADEERFHVVAARLGTLDVVTLISHLRRQSASPIAFVVQIVRHALLVQLVMWHAEERWTSLERVQLHGFGVTLIGGSTGRFLRNVGNS